MPFRSKAQQRFLEAHPEKVGGRAKLKEWESATDFSHLPEKKGEQMKHKFHETHIKHHKDGSHTVHHRHEDPAKDVEHAVADHDGMMDSMQRNLGGGGEEAEAAPGMAGGAPAAGAMA